jgi:CheY-like chemotaxis protein
VKILVVDDDSNQIIAHVAALRGYKVSDEEILTAITLEEANKLYETYRGELDGIILDGCVPGNKLTTLPFIKQTKRDRKARKFSGLVVAASSLATYRRDMVAAGCTHESMKLTAVDILMTALSTRR